MVMNQTAPAGHDIPLVSNPHGNLCQRCFTLLVSSCQPLRPPTPTRTRMGAILATKAGRLGAPPFRLLFLSSSPTSIQPRLPTNCPDFFLAHIFVFTIRESRKTNIIFRLDDQRDIIRCRKFKEKKTTKNEVDEIEAVR